MNALGGFRPPQMGFRPPQGAHLNALMQSRPMSGAPASVPTSVGSQAMTPSGTPMPRGPMVPSGNPPEGGFGQAVQFHGNSGSGLSLRGGPMERLFGALPQGTEELFGAAPAGFNRTLRNGGYKGPLPGVF